MNLQQAFEAEAKPTLEHWIANQKDEDQEAIHNAALNDLITIAALTRVLKAAGAPATKHTAATLREKTRGAR